jgi:JAB1/Mov34/MPN/PAD-1 ubiquitin protease
MPALRASSLHHQCCGQDAQPFAYGLQDRVECGGEQMAEVAQKAEQITKDTGRLTRVVGWYHSHPHITVLPSHIDINTQARPVSQLQTCSTALSMSLHSHPRIMILLLGIDAHAGAPRLPPL